MTGNEPERSGRRELPSELRDELLTLVSHELRTPLTVIAGASRILQRHPAVQSDADLLAVVEDLTGSARRMERVIGNILLLARINEDPAVAEPVLVRVAVASAVASLKQDFPEASVVVVEQPERSMAVNGVATWLRLILLNLLSNAYLHGDRRRPIVVQWATDGDDVKIQVCNSGASLEQEVLDRWFEPFYRSSPTPRELPGAGLGLTVARSLARSQGGELSARPWDTEPGTQLTLSLPVAADA